MMLPVSSAHRRRLLACSPSSCAIRPLRSPSRRMPTRTCWPICWPRSGRWARRRSDPRSRRYRGTVRWLRPAQVHRHRRHRRFAPAGRRCCPASPCGSSVPGGGCRRGRRPRRQAGSAGCSSKTRAAARTGSQSSRRERDRARCILSLERQVREYWVPGQGDQGRVDQPAFARHSAFARQSGAPQKDPLRQ